MTNIHEQRLDKILKIMEDDLDIELILSKKARKRLIALLDRQHKADRRVWDRNYEERLRQKEHALGLRGNW